MKCEKFCQIKINFYNRLNLSRMRSRFINRRLFATQHYGGGQQLHFKKRSQNYYKFSLKNFSIFSYGITPALSS